MADPHLVVRETSKPLNSLPRLIIGSKPIDGGHYIFTDQEKEAFLAEEPGAEPFMRPYIGTREFVNGTIRWILRVAEASPAVLARLPKVRERIAAVRKFRQGRTSKPTQALAATPALYHVNIIPDTLFLVVPKVSSERREYVPIGWIDPPTIPSDLVFVLEDASLPLFALLTSAMHMSWLRHIGGRHESRYRYSAGLVYNTFPMPPVNQAEIDKLEPLAQAVVDARAAHPGSSLADLYDPDLMPANLRKAHQALDRAVDRLYRGKPFTSDRERAEHLFGLYEEMTAPVTAAASKKAPRRKRSR